MKRFLTIFCAIAFSGAVLSAQNNADTIIVNRNESDTLVIIVKEKQSIGDRKVDLLETHSGDEPMIQDTQSGFGAILGYEFGAGISIDISYKICCYNILQPNTSQGVSLYPQTISLGLAYKLGKK